MFGFGIAEVRGARLSFSFLDRYMVPSCEQIIVTVGIQSETGVMLLQFLHNSESFFILERLKYMSSFGRLNYS